MLTAKKTVTQLTIMIDWLQQNITEIPTERELRAQGVNRFGDHYYDYQYEMVKEFNQCLNR